MSCQNLGEAKGRKTFRGARITVLVEAAANARADQPVIIVRPKLDVARRHFGKARRLEHAAHPIEITFCKERPVTPLLKQLIFETELEGTDTAAAEHAGHLPPLAGSRINSDLVETNLTAVFRVIDKTIALRPAFRAGHTNVIRRKKAEIGQPTINRIIGWPTIGTRRQRHTRNERQCDDDELCGNLGDDD